jgi:hypothetical protein
MDTNEHEEERLAVDERQKIEYPQITQISGFGLGNARLLKYVPSAVELRFVRRSDCE